jgi:MOSC domain-containing protein YiiM
MKSPHDGRPRGVLKAIAHRPTDGQPMTEVGEIIVLAGRGPEVENRKPGKREITLLSAESWAAACHDLGVDLPWWYRRANLLIEGLDLSATIGRTLSIGSIRIQVHGETKPCGLMDQQHAGLRQALVPDCRGGVYGQVLSGGTIRVGDLVTLSP